MDVDAFAMTKGYIICGYARTGSTMLSHALRVTGKLGHPQEYFNPWGLRLENGGVYPRDTPSRMVEIAQRSVTANGIYGLKIFPEHFDALKGFEWARSLPHLHFIHLERRDALGQAISYVRAAQTGRWIDSHDQSFVPKYSAKAIMAALKQLGTERGRWQVFFARNGIEPLWLVYEDIVDALPETVQAIAAMLGIDDLPDPLPDLKQTAQQRDGLNDDWRAAFLATHHDLTLLDGLSQPRVQTAVLSLRRGLSGMRQGLRRLVRN